MNWKSLIFSILNYYVLWTKCCKSCCYQIFWLNLIKLIKRYVLIILSGIKKTRICFCLSYRISLGKKSMSSKSIDKSFLDSLSAYLSFTATDLVLLNEWLTSETTWMNVRWNNEKGMKAGRKTTGPGHCPHVPLNPVCLHLCPISDE